MSIAGKETGFSGESVEKKRSGRKMNHLGKNEQILGSMV